MELKDDDNWNFVDSENNMFSFLRGIGSNTSPVLSEPILSDNELQDSETQPEEIQSVPPPQDETFELTDLSVSAESYNRASQGAVNTTRKMETGLLQPWEKGPMKFLFQDATRMDINLFLPETSHGKTFTAEEEDESKDSLEPVDKKKRLGNMQPSFAYCVKCKPDLNFIEKKNADTKLAVGKIVALVEISPSCFQIGRVVLEENELPEECRAALIETVEMVLSMKSPNAVNKRAGSLLLFVKWIRDCERGDPFPITEKDVAAYLFHLRRSGNFTSRGASFREALRFAHYILGLDGALEACDSPRVKGASDTMLCQSGTWHPADPLYVSEVMHFHNILENSSRPLLDRIAAGNILVMTYGRCRASDLAFIKKAHLDYGQEGGYLELGTQHHKSSRKAVLKRKLLPIVIPVMGISKCNWVDILLNLRRKAGLSTEDLDNESWWPAPIEVDGDSIKWGSRPIASDEISSWMVETLKVSGTDRRISSHSAKATCLSWLSKAGVSREDRDVLGRHVTSLHGAAPLYARDLISAPLRKLEETILQVASKTFLPDQNRSGMFTPVTNAQAPQTPAAFRQVGEQSKQTGKSMAAGSTEVKTETVAEVVEIHDSDDDGPETKCSDASTSESDDDNSSGEEDEQLQAIDSSIPSVKQMPIVFEAGCLFFMHKKSKICHFRDKPLTPGSDTNFLECGRKLSANFEQVPSINARSFKCSLCFKNRP